LIIVCHFILLVLAIALACTSLFYGFCIQTFISNFAFVPSDIYDFCARDRMTVELSFTWETRAYQH